MYTLKKNHSPLGVNHKVGLHLVVTVQIKAWMLIILVYANISCDRCKILGDVVEVGEEGG